MRSQLTLAAVVAALGVTGCRAADALAPADAARHARARPTAARMHRAPPVPRDSFIVVLPVEPIIFPPISHP